MKNPKSTTIIGIAAIAIAISILLFFYVKSFKGQTSSESKIRFNNNDSIPDSAISFGYKCQWFAVKTVDKNKLTDKLKLKNISICNWRNGINNAYRGSIFITPAIEGWTMVCGLGLPTSDHESGMTEVKNILIALSKEFVEAQYFCSYRNVGYNCWMKVIDGKIKRVYSFLGETGLNTLIEGEPTDFEKNLNLVNTFSKEAKDNKYLDRKDLVWPDELLTMKVAKHWSIDPSQLDSRKDIIPALGITGTR